MISLLPEKLKDLFRGRMFAYNNVFHKQSVHTRVVLEDLAKFCRAYESTFHIDPRVHATLEGRREVWLRIQQYLKLNEDEVYQLHVVHNKEK